MNQYNEKQYHKLTNDIQYNFIELPYSFLYHCEQIIQGVEYKEFSYFCFHMYTDNRYFEIYDTFTNAVEDLYNRIEHAKFKELSNNVANLLIYLKEPKSRANDVKYKEDNLKYWYEMVKDDTILESCISFEKYVKKPPC